MSPYALQPIEERSRVLTEEECLEEIRQLPDAPIKPSTEPTPGIPAEPEPAITTDLEGRVIDVHSADGEKTHTQDEWIAYFNDRRERMASMPDIYVAGKSGDQALLDSLRKDFLERWMVTSTRITYESGLNVRIIHNYGSTVVQPIVIPVIIPKYQPWILGDVLQTNEGLRFMQVLFGTNDSDQQIKNTLERLSNYPLDKIKVWSAAVSDRPTVRASGFSYFNGVFHVSDNLNLFNFGRTRGVFSNPR